MIKHRQKKCLIISCQNRAHFNFINDKSLYCSFHKKDGMIDLNNKCKFKNCKSSGYFKYINTIGKYCKEHKKNDMINNRSCK